MNIPDDPFTPYVTICSLDPAYSFMSSVVDKQITKKVKLKDSFVFLGSQDVTFKIYLCGYFTQTGAGRSQTLFKTYFFFTKSWDLNGCFQQWSLGFIRIQWDSSMTVRNFSYFHAIYSFLIDRRGYVLMGFFSLFNLCNCSPHWLLWVLCCYILH